MGRKRLWEEDMGARFERGTFKRIDRERDPDETRTDFVRAAVERELQRREAERMKRPAKRRA
jgi:hypothetical protein